MEATVRVAVALSFSNTLLEEEKLLLGSVNLFAAWPISRQLVGSRMLKKTTLCGRPIQGMTVY